MAAEEGARGIARGDRFPSGQKISTGARRQGRELKEEFQGKLDHAGILARLLDLAEGGVAEVAIGIGELRVVPGVVEFRAKFRVPALANRCVFLEGDVRVADGRPAAERMRHVAESAGSGIADVPRIKPNIEAKPHYRGAHNTWLY